MIISESKKYLLLHVPKTGGTSVKNAFKQVALKSKNDVIVGPGRRLCRERDGSIVIRRLIRGRKRKNNHEVIWRLPGGYRLVRLKNPKNPIMQQLPWDSDVVRRQGKHLVKHSTLPEAESFFSQEFYEKLQKIIVVRNPYARIYSAYQYRLREINKKKKRRDPMLGTDGLPIPFESFLEGGLCTSLMASKPQVHWLGKKTADVVLRTENLAEDVFVAMSSLGYAEAEAEAVRSTLLSGRLNVSAGADDWKTMSDQAKELIARTYQEDFECFGYDINIGV